MLRRVGVTGSSVPPIVAANRSSNYTPTPVVEPVQDDTPDFLQPELRRIDDPNMADVTLDPVVERGTATSISQVIEESVPSEVVEVTQDSPKPADSVMVEPIEKPEPKVEEAKPEPKVEEPKPEPKPEPKVVEAKPEPKPKPKPQSVSYRVVKGDTLSSIARRYKVRVSDIKKANGLRSDIIRLKQVLKIPKK